MKSQQPVRKKALFVNCIHRVPHPGNMRPGLHDKEFRTQGRHQGIAPRARLEFATATRLPPTGLGCSRTVWCSPDVEETRPAKTPSFGLSLTRYIQDRAPRPNIEARRSLRDSSVSLRAITATFAKTKTLPQAPASHYSDICQDKNLTTSTCEPLPRHLPRQKPYHKHLRAITATFAKTKTLPQAPASHYGDICQDKNLTTSPWEPLPPHLTRQNPYHKHMQAITATFAKTKTVPHAPASHYHDICQDKNLSTSTCEPLPRHLPRQKPFHKHLRAITAPFAKTKNSTTSTCEPLPRHLARYKPGFRVT